MIFPSTSYTLCYACANFCPCTKWQHIILVGHLTNSDFLLLSSDELSAVGTDDFLGGGAGGFLPASLDFFDTVIEA